MPIELTYDINILVKKEDQMYKARERIPRWANNPGNINYIIMWAYFKAADIDGENRVTKEFMQNLCIQHGLSEKQFKSNFASMKTDSGNNHGKVFEEYGPYVCLWEPIKHIANEHKKYFFNE